MCTLLNQLFVYFQEHEREEETNTELQREVNALKKYKRVLEQKLHNHLKCCKRNQSVALGEEDNGQSKDTLSAHKRTCVELGTSVNASCVNSYESSTKFPNNSPAVTTPLPLASMSSVTCQASVTTTNQNTTINTNQESRHCNGSELQAAIVNRYKYQRLSKEEQIDRIKSDLLVGFSGDKVPL